MSYNSYDHTCNNTLTTSVSPMRFHTELMFILKAINPALKDNMINRIFHSWSFHMKFMILAEGSFYKFHIK